MKIVFVSNYINHHQIPFCEAMAAQEGVDFTFVQLMPMEEERRRMGWGESIGEIPYLRCMYDDREAVRRLILDCDTAIFGWSETCEDLIFERLRNGRPVIRISERIYREGTWKRFSPRGLAAKYRQHIRYRRDKAYLLCAGAYAAYDFSLIGAYPGKRYRWGYFPALRTYDEAAAGKILAERERAAGGSLRLLFAGRLIPLKHPEFAVREAAILHKAGVSVRLTVAGDGPMREELESLAALEGIADLVTFAGAMPPDRIRDRMEESDVFFFTSDHLEGWGAVLSEAMNSMCACVAGTMAGAAPYLIEDGVSGILYDEEDFASFHRAASRLFMTGETYDDPAAIRQRCRQMGLKAYAVMRDEWNAEHAAGALMQLIRAALEDRDFAAPVSGPVSPAPVIRPYLKLTDRRKRI